VEKKTCRKCGLQMFHSWFFHNGEYKETWSCMSNHDKARPNNGKERKRAHGKKEIFRILFTGRLSDVPAPGSGNRWVGFMGSI